MAAIISSKDITIEMIDKLYKELKKIIIYEEETPQITSENIIIIALNLMQIVETYQELKGIEKKQLIINTLKKFVNDEIKDEKPEYKKLLLTIIDTTLPAAIDAFISIDTKQLQIKMKAYLTKCCF